MGEAFDTVLNAVSEPTAELRELMEASAQMTGRLAERTGMNATDAQALYLIEKNGRMGVAELARQLGMRGASATVLVDRLERAGHALRERDPDDRRRVWVRTTPEAMQAILPVWTPAIAQLDAVGKSLSRREQQVVARYLRDARRAMEEMT